MDPYPERAGRVRPGPKFAIWSALLAVELAFAAPVSAEQHESFDITAVVSQFQQICTDLEQARADLRAGTIGDDEFADRILDLFVCADSLEVASPRGGWVRGGGKPGAFALSRSLHYLIESLRENYVGIASKNGIDFIEADRAYQAAVAWRPDIDAAEVQATR